ncbi:23S rRNA (uracil(1939)-C(5))-methyltransferase RlmD [Caloramator sp. E03]|uniref:23S rRNA (uracil(1939)-C(5))-methyltransferase RlmD n=1 Tax=Caloramator sp. E03 TaxID=2576307 RepID=UPI001110963F|nr:23S rRNA (uracil(1939)-C(5))-methyltransferase RlmD [Caloramator sp. E03]QCX34481.1 23S rRNA (uracil(1939)-C(5))-methyltransferase RlmD [Caloramator sp. E03]
MTNNIVKKNEEYEIMITSLGFQGEGVGRIDNFTVFVEGALPNELVRIKIVKVSKNYAFGKLIDIIKTSNERRTPICDIYKRCGGCQIQHISYEAQLKFKKQRVIDSIERIGRIKDVIVHDTIGMKHPYNYRNKVQLPVRMVKGVPVIGFFAARSHEIIKMDKCYIQDEASSKIIPIIKEWIEKNNIMPYDEATGEGIIRHIMIRSAHKTGDIMVVLITNSEKLPHKEEIIEMLKKIKGIKSIIQNINSKKTNVILGDKCNTLWGSDTITDYIGNFKFNISPLSFFQVNPLQTEILYNTALKYANLTGNEVVFDAYCGTGTISLFLAQRAKKVYGVEIVPEAIENAKENAKINNITNAEFIVGESEVVIPNLIEKGTYADVVVVDPPRKGCDRKLLDAISKMSPKRIVYVSCDVGTLARDLGILEELSYKTIEIQPVDMFPQTSHVECVVKIEKK